MQYILAVLILGSTACFVGTIAADPKVFYAVDVAPPLSVFDARCLNISGYSTVFLRVYPKYDWLERFGCESIWNAEKAGLGVEIFMLLYPPTLQDSQQQFNALYDGLKRCKTSFSRFWLAVTSPSTWYFDIHRNIAFIEQVIAQARNHQMDVGIYTTEREWYKITGGFRFFLSTPPIWYWSNCCQPDEIAISFKDFRPFAAWKTPAVKQLRKAFPVCGLIVNRDVYFTPINRTFAELAQQNNASFVGVTNFL